MYKIINLKKNVMEKILNYKCLSYWNVIQKCNATLLGPQVWSVLELLINFNTIYIVLRYLSVWQLLKALKNLKSCLICLYTSKITMAFLRKVRIRHTCEFFEENILRHICFKMRKQLLLNDMKLLKPSSFFTPLLFRVL